MINRLLNETEAQAVLITDPVSMRYISGFRGGEGAVYLSGNRRVLITDSRYTEAAAAESEFTVAEESAERKRYEILEELLREDGVETFAYEDLSMRCSELFDLQEKLPFIRNWERLGSRADDLRQIKTADEIAKMEKAAGIADKALEILLGMLKPGMTEKEGACELEYQMKKLGAEKTSFDTIFASGVNSSMPHAIPSDKKLETGDFVTIDFGCTIDGYCSDMTRTIVLGRADEKQKEIYNIVLQANEAALAELKAGVRGCDIDAIARKVISDAGYGACFGHGLGHSVGLYIHENPRLSKTDCSVIQENMIETVEPGIYIPGWGGVRIEDMVVVTREGYRFLCHSPKELIELGV